MRRIIWQDNQKSAIGPGSTLQPPAPDPLPDTVRADPKTKRRFLKSNFRHLSVLC